MIKDIDIPEVKNVTLAVTRQKVFGGYDEWRVYLINSNNFPIENTLVASKGYGVMNGKKQTTSIIRQYIEAVPANSVILVEPIDPGLFHLNNEYWVSYYIGSTIFDKRFVFVPDTICEENLTYIKELETEGVLHS
jgi:hypothetical protein